jgi:DNA-binding transcriptional ArsR family regulator
LVVEGGSVDGDEDRLSGVFAALADPTRRDIVARLALGDASVSQLAAPYAMSLQAVSKHLRVLEEAGLVSTSQDGQRRPRHLETAVLDAMTAWVDRYRRTAEERFRRLDALLEEQDAGARLDAEPVPASTPRPDPTSGDTTSTEGAPS